MRFQRDPRDRRYPERLAGSFLASLIFHALLAVLLFSVLVSTSELGTNENVEGGEVVTIERAAPVAVANQPAAQHEAAPVPHVPRIAPIRHAAPTQPRTQRLPTNRHELAVARADRTAESAAGSAAVAPTQPAADGKHLRGAAQERGAGSARERADGRARGGRDQGAADRGPLARADERAEGQAVTEAADAQRSAQRQTGHARTRRPPPVAHRGGGRARQRRAQRQSRRGPARLGSARAAPGSAEPQPDQRRGGGAHARHRAQPRADQRRFAGTRQEGGTKNQRTPQRPIELRPTPVPASPAPKSRTAPNINDKLRSLLPNNPVHPASKQYTPTISLHGRLEPTPPPDVLAKTKYLYEVRRTGNELSVKMWVTAAHKEGPTTICTGWLVRYPQPERGGYAPLPSNVQANSGTPNGTQISIGGGGPAHEPLSPFDAGIAPIVDGMVTQACDGRLLAPYAPSAAPSP